MMHFGDYILNKLQNNYNFVVKAVSFLNRDRFLKISQLLGNEKFSEISK